MYFTSYLRIYVSFFIVPFMYTLCAFSLRLVFPSLSFRKSFDPENFEKRHTWQAKKKSPPRSSFFCCRSVRFYYVIHARTRVFVSLFDINERAIAFILSSLARSARARSRFHRSERVGKIIILLLRARPKKSPKLSSASCDPSFFITTRFQKSGSLFGSMRERERRDYLHRSS